jgi:uncharacterized repeat protein (TIGR02543 family)
MKKYLSILMLALSALFTACISGGDEDSDKKVYTVTFETDGGTPVPSAQKVEEGSRASSPSVNPAKEGYTFSFWYVSDETVAYDFQIPVNSDLILHAQWQEEAKYWKVSWELNGGSWPPDDNHATQALQGGTLAKPAAPTKADNTFDGWYKESDLNNLITFPYDLSDVTGDFTLYAKWTPVVTEPHIDFVEGNPTTEYLYKNGFFYGSRIKFNLIVIDAAGYTSISINEEASGSPNGNSKTIKQTREIAISGPGTYPLTQEMWNANAVYADRYNQFTYTVSAHGKKYSRNYTGSYSSYNGGWSHYFGVQ